MVCSFNSDGQYQSLGKWNGQQVRPYAFLLPIINRQGDGPAADTHISTHHIMMKKLLTLVLATIALTPPLAADRIYAERDFQYQGIWYTVIDENAKTCQTSEADSELISPYEYAYFQSPNEVSRDVEIPSKVMNGTDEYTVVAIGAGSFCESRLSILKIPNSVTRIGKHAFDNSTLWKLIIPNSVTYIGPNAFKECWNFGVLVLEDGEQPLSIEGLSAWSYDYTYSDWVQKRDSPFKQTYLADIYLGRDVSCTFDEKNTLKAVSIGDSVTQIPCDAFKGDQITEVNFASLESLCKIKFGNKYSNPMSGGTARLVYIDKEKVTNITLPNTLTSIGDFTFVHYRDLTSVTIPQSVTSIGESAFEGCRKLTTINISDSIHFIGDYAFADCGLRRFTFPDSMNYIPKGILQGCKRITHITMPDNIHEIRDFAFADTPLSSINITSSVTKIGNGVFRNTSLKSISIPSSVTEMGNDVFNSCDALTKVTMPRFLKKVGQGIFANCTNLRTVYSNTVDDSGLYWIDSNGLPENLTIYTIPEKYQYLKELSSIKNIKTPNIVFSGQTTAYPTSLWLENPIPKLEVIPEIDMSDYSIQSVGIYGIDMPLDKMHGTEITGLPANTDNYIANVLLTTPEASDFNCEIPIMPTLPDLEIKTLDVLSVSNDCAIIRAETNMSENESGGGFEWRRSDAPELIKSTDIASHVANGRMESKISGLAANIFYQYRPYYQDRKGIRTYGEWVAFGTTDRYVYFAPTVYTYVPINITDSSAELRGYALAGSDDILEQGFEYSTAQGHIAQIAVSGQRMRLLLENLQPETTYSVRTYATTAQETTYGETMTFTTSTVQEGGIDEVVEAQTERLNNVYTLQGALVRRNASAEEVHSLQPGIYIVGGRKVLVK